MGSLPLLKGLSDQDLLQLHELVVLFLHDKAIEAAGGAEVDDFLRLRIGLQACLPVLRLGLNWYAGWISVIVYPGEFITHRNAYDEAGVHHEWEEVVSGEAWEQGPVVFSIADVEASGRLEGYNVVIHEMAHKLDMLNGEANGFPPLHHAMRIDEWSETMTAAYADMQARLARGEETAIDPYAAEEPGEFFAVLSEYFFEQPHLVQEYNPAVYGLLATFYRQDPIRRLAGRP